MKNTLLTWLFKPVTVDGFLWVCIALFACMQSMLSNDDSYKYVDARFLFWAKFTVACAGASAGALKAFRSTTYADHAKEPEKVEPKPEPKVENPV